MWTRVKDYDKDSVIVFWNYLEFDDLHVAKNRNPHRDGHNPNRHDEVPSQEQLFLVGNINSGTGDGTKTDEFSEKFQRGGSGGWGIFNPKIYIADFGPLYRALKRGFWNKICKRSFQKCRAATKKKVYPLFQILGFTSSTTDDLIDLKFWLQF